jgi:dATP pyrophosphohydrolase
MQIISNMIEAHVFRAEGEKIEFLLLKRSEKEIYSGIWQMVTGKVKDNETAVSAALREIYEETALKPLRFWAAPNLNSFYSAEKDSIILIPVFAALVDKNQAVIISSEHCEFGWFEPSEAKELLAWEGQRKSVDIIENYFLRQNNFLSFVELKL